MDAVVPYQLTGGAVELTCEASGHLTGRQYSNGIHHPQILQLLWVFIEPLDMAGL